MINEYKKRLQFSYPYIRKYIDPKSEGVYKELIEGLIRDMPQRRLPGKWVIFIHPDSPLVFKPCDLNGIDIQVDLFCHIEGKIPSLNSEETDLFNMIEKYDICIRVWSLDPKLSFRENFDSISIKDYLEENEFKRVIHRFHLDKRKPGAMIIEPLYHMHFGGKSHDNERAWFPGVIDAPRFHFFPLDILLAIEFILVNFFATDSYQLREDPVWKSIIRTSQDIFLRPFIRKCLSFLDDKDDTLLAHNLRWN